MKAGLVYDPIYLEHDTGDHVENSRRLVEAMSHLKETGIREKLISLPARPASLEELKMVHAPEYISYVKNKAEKGGDDVGCAVVKKASGESHVSFCIDKT